MARTRQRSSRASTASGGPLRPRSSLGALCFCAALIVNWTPQPATAQAGRGDVDRDGELSVTDAIDILSYLFLGGLPPYCEPAADANDDSEVNIADPVALLFVLFIGNPPLPELTGQDLEECGGLNGPPVLPARPAYRAYPGYPVEFRIEATDPEGEPLRFEPVELPPGAELDAGGLLRWTPAADQLGPFQPRFAVLDGAVPPNRIEGAILFQVLPLDGCNRPRCDPALGCEPELVALPEECCGDPAPPVAELDLGCPEGQELQIGRNPRLAGTIGRLQNCDLLRLAELGQGGYGTSLNFRIRCLDPNQVLLKVRLETAGTVLFDESRNFDFEPLVDGYSERRGIGFVIDVFFSEGQEAQLTATASSGGVTLEKKLRVVITRNKLPDLP